MAPRVTVHAVAAFSKALLKFGCSEVQINGLDNFVKVLADRKRMEEGRGLLTYCNHISVLDEPTIWGALPWKMFRDERTTRWTLGASDVMFTNKFLSHFFNIGQVIETHRGGGIFQPAIDNAISKLEAGKWIHLFPEGYVNVSRTTELRRFKWGIGRMIMEAKKMPVVVPMWISGFDRMMPEPRPPPKLLPRLGAKVSITFGEPIDVRISPLLEAFRRGQALDLPGRLSAHSETIKSASSPLKIQGVQDAALDMARVETCDPKAPLPIHGWPTLEPDSRAAKALRAETDQVALARSQLSGVLRTEMADLGRRVRIANGEGDGEGELVHTAMLQKEVEEVVKDKIEKNR
ncbi:acyltransferase-domain-containing protein [Violaceomyces palustris]|uniref:Acyltransferase-domain-containing protein n=1 Tax=Violaceomyces palustris TaxID=1673888 RepID=A0ACD0NPC5_9BASI|nr:acyltransferase-domain-containing protein [Violaceomyces palustris]